MRSKVTNEMIATDRIRDLPRPLRDALCTIVNFYLTVEFPVLPDGLASISERQLLDSLRYAEADRGNGALRTMAEGIRRRLLGEAPAWQVQRVFPARDLSGLRVLVTDGERTGWAFLDEHSARTVAEGLLTLDEWRAEGNGTR